MSDTPRTKPHAGPVVGSFALVVIACLSLLNGHLVLSSLTALGLLLYLLLSPTLPEE